MEIPNNNNLNFLINIHLNYGEALTGGIIAMHKLAYKLAERGQNVFVFTKPEYPHKNITVIPSEKCYENGMLTYNWESFTFPVNKTISIYDEITKGNPFNTKNVCRWVLYNTLENIENTWGENDIYFNFSNFKTIRKKEEDKLTVFDYKLESLYITNVNNREGSCHILHKNTPNNYDFFLKKYNSINVGEWKTKGGWDYLREIFNKYEYFLTFDRKSFYTVAAALCGCKVIILNVDETNITPQKYRNENEIQRVGISWGEEDIEWADKTLSYVRKHIESLEELDNKTVDNFIKFWKNKCG